MTTYPIRNQEGLLVAFEIEIVYVGLSRVASLLSSVSGVSGVQVRRLLESSSEVRVRFSYMGSDFVVSEPFGDNSRYWIGPREEVSGPVDVSDIERAFLRYRPPLIVRVFGDLVSLKFLGALKKGGRART